MDEASGEESLRRAKQMHLYAKNAMRRELETPMTQVLSPEAREDAQKVAREVWTESVRLLGGQPEVIRVDPNHVKGNLIISGKEKVDETIFKGADLAIDRYTYDSHPETQSRDVTQELWHFYPDHVMKTTRHRSRTNSGELLQPKGLATEKTEAGRDELQALLVDIRASAPIPAVYK